MLTPLALALHEVRQLLLTARERFARQALRGKTKSKQAGRVEALEESEAILKTAVTVQADINATHPPWSFRGYFSVKRRKNEPSERVVVPFESEGGLRELRESRDESNPDHPTASD